MEHRLRLGDFFYNRFTTLGINPIWMARYFSYAILFNLYIIVKSRFNAFVTIFFSLVSLIYLYYMILSGSRGPLLGLIAGLLLFAFLYFRLNLKTIILSLLVLFIVFFSVKILLDSKENIERFTGNKDSISSSTNRLIAQLEAYELLKTNFILGGGFGSFNRYPLQYPHNVFTEILSECGLVGFVILLLLFFFTFMRVMKLDKKKVQNIILSAFLLAGFINANLSGHLGYNMMFWLGVYLVNHVYIIQKTEMNSIN
jgi:O-antigen ligase